MSSAPSLNAERQRRLHEVLAEYLEAVEAGRTPGRSALMARHPDLADELNEFFANHDQMASLAAPPPDLRAAVTRAEDLGRPAAPPAERFGDYEILGEVARGGMGVVYRARQVSLDRDVALKMMLPDQAASPRTLRRFRIEAEAAAHLEHPNIVPIYEVGEIEGRPYFTMKLVEGGCLAGRLEALRLPGPERKPPPGRGEIERSAARVAGLVATVARAIHHAHQHGILHRDLKPANILLDACGVASPATPQAEPVPMVTDFGLAKRVERDVGLTQSQTVVGTPAYMPPEQAEARKDALTTAADVYSLGAILYELLTGEPPFRGETYFDTLIKVIEEPPVPPRHRNPHAPADLEAICLKCLHKVPGHRYHSALALAEDLERWRAGETTSLRRPTRRGRVWRWARRNRLAATLLAAVGVLMALVTAGSLLAARHIAAARDRAEENAGVAARLAQSEREAHDQADGARTDALLALAAAQQARAENQRLLVSGYVGNGTRALDGGDPLGSLAWYGEALHQDRGDPAAEDAHRVRIAAVLRRCPRLVQAWFDNAGTPPPPPPAAFSPDGRRVLLIHKDAAAVYDVASGKAVSAPMKHAGEVRRGAFSPDGSRVVTVADDGTARVWEAEAGKAIIPALHHDKVRWAAFSPDGGRLATVGADRDARLWEVATGRLLAGPLSHDVPLLFASFSRDGKHLVACGGDAEARKGEVRVWDLTSAKPSSRSLSRAMVVHWAYLVANEARPADDQIVAAGGRNAAHLWSLATGRWDGHDAAVARLDPDGAVGPDLTRVVKVDGSAAQVFDLAANKPVGSPLLHGGPILVTALSPDGRLVATAAADRTARVWDAVSGKPLTPPLHHGMRVVRIVFSADGRRLLTTTDNGIVRVWDLAPRGLAQPLPALTAPGPRALSPDGRLLADGDKAGWVEVKDAVTRKVARGPWKLPGAVSELAFSPDGRRVLATSESGARVWDAISGEPVTPMLPHTGPVQRLLFTPDGSRAVILKERLEVYDLATGAAQFDKAPAVSLPAFGPALTPDGRSVVVFRTVQNIDLKDVATGAHRAGPFRHTGRVTDAAVSPDGKRLAVATADGDAFLWDVATARPAAPPLQHGTPLRQVAFSADGRRLLTLAEDNSARAWDGATGQPISPLLPHDEPIAAASLSADGRRLVARARGGAAWVWDLSPDDRPVDDLVSLTQILAGQAVDGASGGLVPLELGSLRNAWPGLRAKYPREFGPSP
jgi:WD40 repeat protein